MEMASLLGRMHQSGEVRGYAAFPEDGLFAVIVEGGPVDAGAFESTDDWPNRVNLGLALTDAAKYDNHVAEMDLGDATLYAFQTDGWGTELEFNEDYPHAEVSDAEFEADVAAINAESVESMQDLLLELLPDRAMDTMQSAIFRKLIRHALELQQYYGSDPQLQSLGTIRTDWFMKMAEEIFSSPENVKKLSERTV